MTLENLDSTWITKRNSDRSLKYSERHRKLYIDY